MTAEETQNIAEFFKNDQNKMVAFVRRLIDDAADRDGEDIVQDVMVKVFDAHDVTEPIENLAAYIYTSLRNRVTDLLRKRKDQVSLDQPIFNEEKLSLKDLISDIRYDTANEVEKKEMQESLFKAIDSLNADDREIVILTEFEGWSFREISETFDIPIGTLLSRKSRALKKIRKALEKGN